VVLGVEAGDQGIGPDDRHHRHEPRRVGDVQPTVEDELAEAGMCLLGGSDYAEIGAVTNLASRLADEATPGPDPDLPAPLAEVEDDVEVGPVGEFTLKGSSGRSRPSTSSPSGRTWSSGCLRQIHNMPIYRDFYGSDGTRTRDSGVTGRSSVGAEGAALQACCKHRASAGMSPRSA
jgi:hypothetical protein